MDVPSSWHWQSKPAEKKSVLDRFFFTRAKLKTEKSKYKLETKNGFISAAKKRSHRNTFTGRKTKCGRWFSYIL